MRHSGIFPTQLENIFNSQIVLLIIYWKYIIISNLSKIYRQIEIAIVSLQRHLTAHFKLASYK